MPIFDYECTICGKKKEVLTIGKEIAENQHICEKCGVVMKKMFPVGTSFKLKYDPKKDKVSWGDQNYSSTQRYREIRK